MKTSQGEIKILEDKAVELEELKKGHKTLLMSKKNALQEIQANVNNLNQSVAEATQNAKVSKLNRQEAEEKVKSEEAQQSIIISKLTANIAACKISSANLSETVGKLQETETDLKAQNELKTKELNDFQVILTTNYEVFFCVNLGVCVDACSFL
jgi:hypothetical protein